MIHIGKLGTDLLADLLVDRLALLLPGVLEALLLVRRLAVLLGDRPALLKVGIHVCFSAFRVFIGRLMLLLSIENFISRF